MLKLNSITPEERANTEKVRADHTEKSHAEFSAIQWAHHRPGSNPQADFPQHDEIQEVEALEACLLRLDAHDDQSAPECMQARKALIKAGYTLD